MSSDTPDTPEEGQQNASPPPVSKSPKLPKEENEGDDGGGAVPHSKHESAAEKVVEEKVAEEQVMLVDKKNTTEERNLSLPIKSKDSHDGDTDLNNATKLDQTKVHFKSPPSDTSSDTSSARERKNERSRGREAELRIRVEEIKSKPVEARTKEEMEFYETYESKRQRKNEREKQRMNMQKEEIDRILKIPEEERTQDETAYLEKVLASKNRKNELDRQRRKNLTEAIQKFVDETGQPQAQKQPEQQQQQQQVPPPHEYPLPPIPYGYYPHDYPTQPSPSHLQTKGSFPPGGVPAYYPHSPYPYPPMAPPISPRTTSDPLSGAIGEPVPSEVTVTAADGEPTACKRKEEFEKTIGSKEEQEDKTSKLVVDHKSVPPIDESQLKDEEERLLKRRAQEISMKPKEKWTKEEIALHESHQQARNNVPDGNYHHPSHHPMFPHQHHHPYHPYGYHYYGSHPPVSPSALGGHYGYHPAQSGGFYPALHHSAMFPPYHHPNQMVPPPQVGTSAQSTRTQVRREEAAEPMQHERSGDDQGTEEVVPDEENPESQNVARLKTYIKPRIHSTQEVVDRRTRKNAQSRSRAAKLRERITEIEGMLPEDRTQEEAAVYEQYEQRRQRKNDRSRERAMEKKEEIDRILSKAERHRTKIEKAFLVNALGAKKRKNEGDRLRRQRLKQLGLNARGMQASPNAKPGISARGPMPAGYPSYPTYETQCYPYYPTGYGGYAGAPEVAQQPLPTTAVDGEDGTRMDFAPPRSPPVQEPAEKADTKYTASDKTEQREGTENAEPSAETAPTASVSSPQTPTATGGDVYSV